MTWVALPGTATRSRSAAAARRLTWSAANRVALTGAALLGVGLAAVLPYLPVVTSYFLSDDFGLVQLFSSKPSLHFLSLFIRPWTEAIYGIQPDELRPMLALSYQVDSLWGAASPTGYHVSNIVLHALNALFVLGIARVSRLSLPAATFAGVLFAVLPNHAETVAWISGRADSIVALFYLSALLAYAAWRRLEPGVWLYAVSLGAFFLALFSKQSAITMLATLVMYDLMVEGRRLRWSWASLWPYVPFACLTLGYLGLRYVLFGNAVREHQVSAETLLSFVSQQGMFLKTLAAGSSRIGVDGEALDFAVVGLVLTWLALGLGLALAAAQVWRTQRQGSSIRGTATAGRALLYFGPVWWLISVAPLAVTYVSPRHLYLASAGIAIALAALFDVVSIGRPRIWQFIAALSATVLVLTATLSLEQPVAEWKASANISARIRDDIQREMSAAPTGSLLIINPPVTGASKEIHTWVWMWASPFALQPPFMPHGLAERVVLIEPPDVYCCTRDQWFNRTRQALAAWLGHSDRPPAIMLRWDVVSGALDGKSDLEDSGLRIHVAALAEAPTYDDMCRSLEVLVGDLGDSCAPA
jgi:hypothetical protein